MSESPIYDQTSDYDRVHVTSFRRPLIRLISVGCGRTVAHLWIPSNNSSVPQDIGEGLGKSSGPNIRFTDKASYGIVEFGQVVSSLHLPNFQFYQRLQTTFDDVAC